MYDRILVPTDGSDATEKTVTHALKLAADNDATIHALYVIDKRIVQAGSKKLQSEVRDELNTQGKKAVSAVRSKAEAADVPIETAITSGTPDKEIASYAEANSIDLITIGTHGKTPREKLQSLGSVSERVVDSASCPVLVVK